MNLFFTKTHIGGLDEIVRRLKCRKLDLDSRYIIITPDKYTLETEEAVVAALNEGGTMDIEVMTLERISRLLLNSEMQHLTREGSVMIVSHLLYLRKNELKYFKAGRPNTSRDIYNTIAQLESSGMSPADIPKTSGLLDKKLFDLKILYEDYNEIVEKNFIDAGKKLRLAAGNADSCAWLKNVKFFAAGFDRVTVSALKLLNALDSNSSGIDWYIPESLRHSGIYEDLVKTADITSTIDERLPVLKQRVLDVARGEPTLAAPAGENNKTYFAYRAESSFRAVEYAARLICYYTFELGFKLSDIGVVRTAPLSRQEAAKLKSYGIRINTSVRQSLNDNPFAKFLLNVFKAVIYGYPRATMCAVACSPVLNIARDEFSEFDNYCQNYSIDFNKFVAPFVFGKTDKDGRVDPRFAAAERVRSIISDVVGAIGKSIKNCRTGSDFIALSKDFLARYKSGYQKFSDACDTEFQMFAGQFDEKIEAIFENLLTASGNDKMSREDYLSALESGMDACPVASTPAFKDAVNIFSAEFFRLKRYKVMIFLDCNEGSFPPQVRDEGIITDAEIEAVKLNGCDIRPKAETVNALYRLQLADSLTLSDSCHLVTVDSAENQSAYIYRNIVKALGLFEGSDAANEQNWAIEGGKKGEAFAKFWLPQKAPAWEEARVQYAKMSGLGLTNANAVISALYRLMNEDGVSIYSSPEADTVRGGKALFFDKAAGETIYSGTSISRLESYFQCPYAHFIKYGLGLKPRAEGRMRAADIGSALHFIAEKFILKTPGSLEDCIRLSEDIAEELFSSDEYFSLDSSLRREERRMIRAEAARLCSVIYEDLSNSRYKPAGAEICFGRRRDDNSDQQALRGIELKAGENKITISGVIDRIDIFEGGARVIDYKTGYAGCDLREVYYGKKIQLFIYLKAVRDGGMRPVGAMYMPVSNDYTREGKEDCTYLGWVSSDAGDCADMDTRLITDGYSRAIGVKTINNKKTRASGEFLIKQARHSMSQEQFDKWINYSFDVSQSAAAEMCGGYIAKSPLKLSDSSACDYCDSFGLCGGAEKIREHEKQIKK